MVQSNRWRVELNVMCSPISLNQYGPIWLTLLVAGCGSPADRSGADPNEVADYYSSIGAAIQYGEGNEIISVTLGNVRPKVSGDALQHIPRLRRLKYLDITHTEVGDKGIKYLENNPTITHLSMRNCNATAQSVEILASMARLEQLEWGDNSFTEDDLDQLKVAKPSIKLFE